jgi:diacylglycerol kinase (ATP)
VLLSHPMATPSADLSTPHPHPRPVTGTRALVILNRKARHGRSGATAALQRLERAGFELIEERVDRPQLLSPAIRRARERVHAVILGGGDGTLNLAADGLVDAQLPVGILPLGTANDLARTLGVPLDPAAAADVIARGHLKRIDVGWVNGTHFFNAATVGLGTGVARRLNRERKSRWGVLAYLFAAARVMIHARPFAADIRTESETIRVRTVQVTVGNGPHYGGGMTIDETATIDDGLLHLLSLEVEHWWQMIPLLPALRHGRLSGVPHARMLRGREFKIQPVKKKRRIQVTADGEISGRTPAHFRVIPRALSVFVPQAEVSDG